MSLESFTASPSCRVNVTGGTREYNVGDIMMIVDEWSGLEQSGYIDGLKISMYWLRMTL